MKRRIIALMAAAMLMLPAISIAEKNSGVKGEHKAKSSTMKASMGMMRANMGLMGEITDNAHLEHDEANEPHDEGDGGSSW
jgi:hypothetical protein